MPAGGCACDRATWQKSAQFVLAGGRWNDSQIVSKAWIETSTAPKIEATGGQSVGYLWWRGGREFPWIGAFGRGGQSIRIVPNLDLVVAVTAGYYQDLQPASVSSAVGRFQGRLAGGFRLRAELEAPPCCVALIRLWHTASVARLAMTASIRQRTWGLRRESPKAGIARIAFWHEERRLHGEICYSGGNASLN